MQGEYLSEELFLACYKSMVSSVSDLKNEEENMLEYTVEGFYDILSLIYRILMKKPHYVTKVIRPEDFIIRLKKCYSIYTSGLNLEDLNEILEDDDKNGILSQFKILYNKFKDERSSNSRPVGPVARNIPRTSGLSSPAQNKRSESVVSLRGLAKPTLSPSVNSVRSAQSTENYPKEVVLEYGDMIKVYDYSSSTYVLVITKELYDKNKELIRSLSDRFNPHLTDMNGRTIKGWLITKKISFDEIEDRLLQINF